MPSEKLVIASMKTGLQTNTPPFFLDNDAFPILQNAYIWRQRLLKKRGTQQLGRLRRDRVSQALGNTNGSGALSVNIISHLSLQSSSQIAPGSITVHCGVQIFVESVPPDGLLHLGTSSGSPTGNSINYATGALTIQTAPVLATTAVTISFSYYPSLPAMGLCPYQDQTLATDPINFPTNVFFDTVYAYQYSFVTSKFFDASFYKMPAPQNPVTWSGQNYQQFNSTNYQNALFVTNNNPGFAFGVITAISAVGGPPSTSLQVTSVGNTLVVGDKVFLNEISGMVEANGLTGTVTVTGDTFTIAVPSTTFTAYTSGGIFQYLTQKKGSNDGIRWYDGFGPGFGFSNYSPPLQHFDATALPHPSYLVGARILIPYQSRLLAFGTYEQTSVGAVQYFPNRFRYCELGTCFYANFPDGGSAVSDAWIDNIPGKGGFVTLDTPEKILTANVSQEVLIIGLERTQRKIIGNSNPLDPYTIQTINPEFGSESTFSTVVLDTGVLSVGDFGYILTTAYNAERFDLRVIDEVFQIQNNNNGNERVCAVRDWKNEYIYFTYPTFSALDVFPTKTLLFNYKEGNFALFDEQYTCYGLFRPQDDTTWATLPYATWSEWTLPWNTVQNAARFPYVCGGNQQGFFLLKDVGTLNAQSHYISALSSNTLTSPNHGITGSAYIYIQNCIGSTNLNNQIVLATRIDNNILMLDVAATGSYLGLGTFSILDNVVIKSKMFPLAWSAGKGTRIGSQLFLADTTTSGEITVDIFCNENQDTPVNDPLLSPYLPMGNVLLTRPGTSIGLYDAQFAQAQIWHRMQNSFTGDTVQLGFHFSDSQMRDIDIQNADFVLYAVVFEYYASRVLA